MIQQLVIISTTIDSALPALPPLVTAFFTLCNTELSHIFPTAGITTDPRTKTVSRFLVGSISTVFDATSIDSSQLLGRLSVVLLDN